MDLETLLPSIRSLHDLTGLVAALGHQPTWEEVPDPSLKLTVVARTGELPWFAIESRFPERDAGRLALRLSRRGRMCLVFALDPQSSRLTLAVGFDSCPRLEMDLNHASAEAVASLSRLGATAEGGSLAFVARAADALAAETVGRRFFRVFRATLDRMAAGLPGPMPGEDRDGLALLQLTRILFLYFIQTKGWLGGRERFLAEEVEKCLAHKRRIHGDLLRPLFFGTLNRPRAQRSRVAALFGSIPFLNGGLFEPHPLERRFRADIPNPVWRDAFDQLFERFHFTVMEGHGHGGVAPDMLGRVFEGVMAPEARHASGTFYTPAALVGSVMDAALVALIGQRLKCGDGEAERRLRAGDPDAARTLTSITVLDPAVGSGAFLLGALDRLSSIEATDALSARKRRVLQGNLFGVDLSTAAVRLTELRLWLAVIADDPAERASEVSPLPNLDCLIRQGDSLFDPLSPGIDAVRHEPKIVAELSRLRRCVITASGADKQSLIRRLRTVEARALGSSLGAAESRVLGDVSGCLNAARGRDLFGERRGLDRELRSQLKELRSQLRSLRQARRKLARDGSLPWFHYGSHFADVFARGGFDIVAGNPPWLRSEDIPSQVRERLTGRYRWWRSSAGGFGNRPDLAVAFLERSVELAAPSGIVAMLVPAKVASAAYGATARHSLASTTTLHAIANLTEHGAEFDATVYPMALIAGKATPAPRHRVRTTLAVTNELGVSQAKLIGGGPWILVKDCLRSVLETLQTDHPALGERFISHLGVKTGANHVFLGPPEDLEPEVLRWAIRGRDIAPFRCASRTRLLWTHDAEGQPRLELPPRCTAYLARHQAQLRARRDYTGGPPWTVFRARPAVARYRVVWPDLARRLTAAALTTGSERYQIPLNSCYVVTTKSAVEAERLAVCLNSTWLRAVARLGAVPAAGGFARFNARTIARLPLPGSVLADSALTRFAGLGRTGALIQGELDAALAVHLNLSGRARNALRAVVDGAARHRR
ncbi:MAG TPA: N-6 DNA methylase [Gemmatimonadales bacterium]|nr:N-6 DNA methylase [Gemmatimonadales bacterium]